MPNRFCAICGKTIGKNAPHFSMCLECYLKENPLFTLPDKFRFKLCIDCGSYSKREKWINAENGQIFSLIEEAIERYVLKPQKKFENIYFDIEFNEDSILYTSRDLIKSLEAVIIGTSRENPKFYHQEEIKVFIDYELCKNCSNLRSGTYYLSILQLRVNEERYFDFIDKAIDEIQSYVESQFKKDKRQYITKMVDEKFGVDLFLSTKELLNHLISHLRNDFHFQLKRSKKLVGRDTQGGKNLYRIKASVRFLPFKKNDVLEIDNALYSVENFTKNSVILKNKEGEKIVKDFTSIFHSRFEIK